MVTYNVNLEGKTVLVTGAAGFIASNLVKRLFHDVKDIRVVGIDSITDYYDVNIKYERLKEIDEQVASLKEEGKQVEWTFLLHGRQGGQSCESLCSHEEEQQADGSCLCSTTSQALV